MAKSKLTLTPEDYTRIDKLTGIEPSSDQFYTVVTTKQRGRAIRSIHVFSRMPTPQEVTKFEDVASKVKVRGRKTEFEGSAAKAFRHLYDALILRAYDVPSGFRILGEIPEGTTEFDPKLGLSREQAIEKVPTVIKREALRDSMSETYSEARLIENEGDEEDVKDATEDD